MTVAKPPAGVPGAQTLERGLGLVERVVNEPMALRELAASAGLAINTTRRLAGSLVGYGFLALGPDKLYRSGPKLLELGARARDQQDIVVIARPHLAELSAATGAPSFLGERDGDYSVHLHRAPGRQRVAVSTAVGTRRKLPETSLGKALLFDDPEHEWDRLFANVSPEFRPEGWKEAMHHACAVNFVVHDAPSPDRIRAMASPIRDASGKIVAAISFVSPLQYAGDDEVERVAPLVCTAALSISEVLGYSGSRQGTRGATSRRDGATPGRGSGRGGRRS